MADLVGNRVVPHVQRKQFTDIRAGWRLAIFGALQITIGFVWLYGHGLQSACVMLSATDFLHLIIIMGFVVDAVKVGNVNI